MRGEDANRRSYKQVPGTWTSQVAGASWGLMTQPSAGTNLQAHWPLYQEPRGRDPEVQVGRVKLMP